MQITPVSSFIPLSLARLLGGLALLLALAQPAMAVNIVYDGSCANGPDRLAVANAVARATTWANDAYNEVNNNEQALRNNPPSPYLSWFGTFEQDRYQRVRGVLDGVRFKLNSDSTMTAYCRIDPAAPCDDAGDIAATDARVRGDFNVWFCHDFFALHANVGFDTQAGSVLHEMTHSIGNTEDIPGAYGTDGAGNLATQAPARAVDNADNYEFFVEQLYD
ncbi:MAG: M35 family metallo-endopeptidase [Pseudomonas sp.]|uniref:M35 family metallo-endopeptidase n=1 Tax=Pseudomonas sp. TaxID=306 RepID=UPI003982C408